MSEDSPVAIVTGASRGAGRGIARALGSHGCTVYVTGRSEQEGAAEAPGTIYATAAEVTAAGGQGIAVRCDHSDDAQTEAMIERFIVETGWYPTATKPVAGALTYTKYSFIMRLVMKRIARAARGSTDTRRDHVYTDWAALDRFVADFVSGALEEASDPATVRDPASTLVRA